MRPRVPWAIVRNAGRLAGAEPAPTRGVPTNTYKVRKPTRGFISAVLAPVNCRHEPRFGERQTMWVVTLAFGTMAFMRLFLAN